MLGFIKRVSITSRFLAAPTFYGSDSTLSVFGTGANLVSAWAMDAATDETVSTAVMLHGFAGGSVTVKVHWTATTNAALKSVIWVVTMDEFAQGQDLDASSNTATAESSDGGSNGFLRTSPAMTFTEAELLGFNENDIHIIRVTRNADDASDTFVSDAMFIGLEINYPRNHALWRT